MAIPQSVAEVLKSHVTLELEGIDRMYLNLYVPRLQHERGVGSFFRYHRGHQFASSALMAPMTRDFVALIESYVEAHGVPLITFEKGERKDDVVKPYFADFEGEEGVVVVGKAQEKTRVLRTVKRRNATTGKTYEVDTRDFGIGKGLHNLAALRRVGFQANRRLLNVERISHDCHIGEAAWTEVTRPVEVAGQRGSALRFDDPAVHALLGTLVILRLLPQGFANKDLRQNWAQLLGQDPRTITPGRMTYQLRRLRLHGMIERIPKSHRYRVTEPGMRIAIFFTRTLARLLRPGLSQILPQAPPGDHRLRRDFDRLQASIDSWIAEANMAA